MSNMPLNLKIEEGIATVTLARPEKHNALNMDMFKAIDNSIKQLKSDRSIRVVIVNGNGPSFCSGLDIKGVLSKPTNAFKLLWKWLPGNANLAQRVSIGWQSIKVPVIMVIHGKCWGGGLQIALGGDFRIASEDSSLSIMELKWGLIPDMGGTPALKANISCDDAMLLAMTSDEITAQQGKEIGLITTVASDPMLKAKDLALQLCKRSPDSNAFIKKMYWSFWSPNTRKMLAKETINQIRVLLGKNQRIAVMREQGQTKKDFIL